MKLTGSKKNGNHTQKKGRHLKKNVSGGSAVAAVAVAGAGAGGSDVLEGFDLDFDADGENGGDKNPVEAANGFGVKPKKPMTLKKKILMVVAVVFGFLVLITTIVVIYVIKASSTPPPVWSDPKGGNKETPGPYNPDDPAPTGDVDPNNPNVPMGSRKPGQYTFLVLALDDGNGNTDVIMVVNFDTTNYTLNVVSIPRDTVANVGTTSKKINAILSNKRAAYRSEKDRKVRDAKAMGDTVAAFADVLGFEVDYWFLVNMDAFITLVDAVGGVEYTVQSYISHPEFSQSYSAGRTYQLNGQQALDIMRFRGYRNGDIGRINVRQDFLTVAVKQIMAKKASIDPVSIADIFFNHVNTDAELSYLIYFAREFFKLDSANVNFDILPGFYNDSYNGTSYVTIHVDDWLNMVNEKLSPFYKKFTPTDVSILTRGSDKKFYVTDGNIVGDASWGGGIKKDGSGSYGDANPGTLPSSPPATQPTTPSTPASPSSTDDTEPPDTPPTDDLPPTDDPPPTDDSPPPTDDNPPPTGSDTTPPPPTDNPPPDSTETSGWQNP